MPETVKFEDLFVPATVTRDRKAGQKYEVTARPGLHKVQGWVQNDITDRYDSFYAMPTEKLVRAVADSMLRIDYDTIYFKAYDRGDYIEVYGQYNQIIGSRSLFNVDKSTWVELPAED